MSMCASGELHGGFETCRRNWAVKPSPVPLCWWRRSESWFWPHPGPSACYPTRAPHRWRFGSDLVNLPGFCSDKGKSWLREKLLSQTLVILSLLLFYVYRKWVKNMNIESYQCDLAPPPADGVCGRSRPCLRFICTSMSLDRRVLIEEWGEREILLNPDRLILHSWKLHRM